MIYKISNDYYVRQLRESDVNGVYPSWFDDQEVCQYNSHGKLFKTQAHFSKYIDELNSEACMVWAICHTIDGHIGNASLQEISLINRTAEFAIIMGDKNHWGKRVGQQVGRKMLTHGFSKLNLERIYCGTASSNLGMKRLAISLGMVQEGVRRRHLFLDGERVDMVEYGILAAEFNSNYQTCQSISKPT